MKDFRLLDSQEHPGKEGLLGKQDFLLLVESKLRHLHRKLNLAKIFRKDKVRKVGKSVNPIRCSSSHRRKQIPKQHRQANWYDQSKNQKCEGIDEYLSAFALFCSCSFFVLILDAALLLIHPDDAALSAYTARNVSSLIPQYITRS